MDTKPTKRHPSLQPLSRHHHHALVVAQMLIKQQEPLDVIRDKLRDFWEHGGREHFSEEEEYLLPEFAKHQPIDIPEIRELLLEHIRIRSLVSEIAIDAHHEKMSQLGELLREHVRKEERVVFPMIEAGLPEASLRKLEPFFSEHKKSSVFFSGNSDD
jgi:hemerythrin-like domain-containing protein